MNDVHQAKSKGTVAFIVAYKPKDGSLPKSSDLYYEKIFFRLSDAEKYKEIWGSEFGIQNQLRIYISYFKVVKEF